MHAPVFGVADADSFCGFLLFDFFLPWTLQFFSRRRAGISAELVSGEKLRAGAIEVTRLVARKLRYEYFSVSPVIAPARNALLD